MKRRQLLGQGGSIRFIRRLSLGIGLTQPRDDRRHGLRPKTDIEPQVRIVVPLKFRRFQKPILRHTLRHGIDPPATASHSGKEISHPTLQHQPAVKHHVGPAQRRRIGGGRLVEMRIHAGSHHLGHLHAIPAHLLHQVRHHPNGHGGTDLRRHGTRARKPCHGQNDNRFKKGSSHKHQEGMNSTERVFQDEQT